MVNVDRGVDVFVQDWGDGKPVVLVHGWPLSHLMFEYQVPTLANNGYRVVAMDLRGYGMSDKPWTGLNYDTWADDIRHVLRTLGLRDVTLCGFSMGGAVVSHYVAKTNDGRVTKLALFAAASPCMIKKPDNPDGVPLDVWSSFIQAELADRARFKRDFNANFFHNPASPELAHWFESIGMQVNSYASLRGLEELRDRDLRAELSSIKIPTTIFHGVNDKIVPFALGEEQNRLIAGSELVRFENSGHGLFFEEREKFTAELLRFLSEGERPKIAQPIPT